MSSLVDRFIHKYGRLPTEVDPDYLEMLRMSKYRILAVPDFSPGKCANCGASKDDGRKYVDTGLLVDWYGTVYFCGICVHDLADAMGKFDELRSKLLEAKETKQRIEELKVQGDTLHEIVVSSFKELEEYYANLHSLGDDSSTDSSSELGAIEAATESAINAAKSRATKSTPSSGRKNVPGLAELLSKSDPS